MDIKKILVVAAILLIAIIGYNYYSSAQSEKARAAHMAETEALRASNEQAMAALKKPEPEVDEGVELEPIDDKPKEVDIEAEKSKACGSVSDFAESVMEARLRGIPIQDALGAIDGSDMSAVYKSTFKGVIIQAYKQPNFSTDEYKKEAIREFALKQYLACISAFDTRK